MKKVLAAVLSVMMLLLPCAALAEQTPAPEAEPVWYELSAEDTVLTVRLPGTAESGLTWSYEIFAPEALELITHETIEGESEGMAGTPTTYVASFMTMAGAEHTGTLILNCADETRPEEAPAYTRVLELSADKDNKLTVRSVLEMLPNADWCEYGEDGYILTVRLPGEGWSFELVHPEVLELITCEETDGTFVGSFMSAMDQFGLAEIVFTSDDGLSQRTVDLFVNESGELFVEWVSLFDILVPEQAG